MTDKQIVTVAFSRIRERLEDEGNDDEIVILDSLEEAMLAALRGIDNVKNLVARPVLLTDDAQPFAFRCDPDESAGAKFGDERSHPSMSGFSVKVPDEPSDDEIYNRSTGPHTGVEGGIAYDTSMDEPGSLGENDWRL